MIDSKNFKFFCARIGASCHHLHYDKLPFFLSHIEHTNILNIYSILHVHLTLFATRNLILPSSNHGITTVSYNLSRFEKDIT